MSDLYISKIIRTGNSLCVVIPKNILHALNLQRGDQVVFGISAGDVLMIKKITNEDKKLWKI